MAIHQSTWQIAEQVNTLRNLQGTGHGRTLPTGITRTWHSLSSGRPAPSLNASLRCWTRHTGDNHSMRHDAADVQAGSEWVDSRPIQARPIQVAT
jgi:hypothetical protein